MNLKAEEIPKASRDCISFQLANNNQEPIAENESNQQALQRAFDEVPQKKLIEQAQYLKEVMLPAIEKNRGLESKDYKFYYAVFESLMYSIAILDRDYIFRYQLSNEKLMNEFLQKKIIFYELELQRYTTIESLRLKELTTNLLTPNSTL